MWEITLTVKWIADEKKKNTMNRKLFRVPFCYFTICQTELFRKEKLDWQTNKQWSRLVSYANNLIKTLPWTLWTAQNEKATNAHWQPINGIQISFGSILFVHNTVKLTNLLMDFSDGVLSSFNLITGAQYKKMRRVSQK